MNNSSTCAVFLRLLIKRSCFSSIYLSYGIREEKKKWNGAVAKYIILRAQQDTDFITFTIASLSMKAKWETKLWS